MTQAVNTIQMNNEPLADVYDKRIQFSLRLQFTIIFIISWFVVWSNHKSTSSNVLFSLQRYSVYCSKVMYMNMMKSSRVCESYSWWVHGRKCFCSSKGPTDRKHLCVLTRPLRHKQVNAAEVETLEGFLIVAPRSSSACVCCLNCHWCVWRADLSAGELITGRSPRWWLTSSPQNTIPVFFMLIFSSF